MIKVCVINPNYYRSSGVTVAIRSIFDSVKSKDIDNFFVSCNYGNEIDDIRWIPHDKLIVFKLMSNNPFVLFYNLLLFVFWLRSNEIDVIHTHHRRIAAFLTLFSFLFNAKILYTGALTYDFSLLFWLLCPDNVVAITPSVKENIIKTTRAKNIRLIGNPTLFPSIPPTINKIDIYNKAICVARLEPVKGHLNLIEAWGILIEKGHDYILTLVGEGSLQDEIKKNVRQLKLENHVFFKGYTSDVISEFENNLFAILVSQIEGQGIVTIEAASVGRASILTDVDGSRDCLPPDRILPNGLLYGDVVALANSIEYWFSHPDEVIKEGKIFFNFHEKHNSMQVIGEKYTSLYKDLNEFK